MLSRPIQKTRSMSFLLMLFALSAAITDEPIAGEPTAVEPTPSEQWLRVTATAYNSTRAQTDSRPNKGAWGDTIEPGMKVLAVSPDLVRKGLKRGVKVRIDGIEGDWIVLDRTPSRLRNHIDIYMGIDIDAARKWGRKKVTIRWASQSEASSGLDQAEVPSPTVRTERIRFAAT